MRAVNLLSRKFALKSWSKTISQLKLYIILFDNYVSCADSFVDTYSEEKKPGANENERCENFTKTSEQNNVILGRRGELEVSDKGELNDG